jgi:hypothetical protein
MNNGLLSKIAVASLVVAVIAGCASVKPSPYAGLSSSGKMTQNSDASARHIPYKYKAPVNWKHYTQVVVAPVVIYTGADAQFGNLSDDDKNTVANYMAKSFKQRLETRFTLAKEPAPGTLRIQLTLTGVQKTTAFLGQVSHIDIGGNLYNGVQAMTGGRSAFGGSVSYAVEVYDSQSGALLEAYVANEYPNAMNFPAAFGALGAAKAGIDKGAKALVQQLQ